MLSRLFCCLVFVLIYFFLLGPGLQCLLYAEEIKCEKANDENGFVRIITQHRGLQVFVNGAFKGFTPVGVLSLPPGSHTFSLSHPAGFSWLDTKWTSAVRVTANDTVTVRPHFMFSYSIRTQPYGAEIYKDGVAIGTTPKFIRVEEGDLCKISLVKEGYHDTTFVIDSISPFSYDLILQPDLFAERNFSTNAMKESSSKSKLYLYSAIGVSLAAGALALYFRDKGNSTYDKYLVAEEPERSRLFDETRRYDKYAAVSFGAFQLGFVFSVYFLLTQKDR